MKLIEPIGFETTIIADSIVFAHIGDYGYAGTAEQNVADLVKSWNPDFIISSGDNNYSEGKFETIEKNISQYYGDYIFNYDAPIEYRCNGKAFNDSINRFFPCPGNHDNKNNNGLTPYLNFFTLPGDEKCYTITWGPVTFYSLNIITENSDKVQEWLIKQTSLSVSPFNIVNLHYPCFSEGEYGGYEYLQWDFQSMGVDVIFSGHEHIYNRIEKIEEKTVHYIVNGLGGRAISPCGANELPTDEFQSFCYTGDYGAVKVTADYDKMILAFYAVNNPNIAADSIVLFK